MKTSSVIPDMPRAAYDATPSENFSVLKFFAQSPRHYLAAKAGTKDSRSKKRGRATHVACLEPEKFNEHVVVFDGKKRTGKAWDAFEAHEESHLDREILTAPEYEVVKDTAISVRGNEDAMRYLCEGNGEVTILWEALGVPLKSRLDWISPLGLCDLKNSRTADPRLFPKEVANYETLAQAAMYTDAFKAATGEVKPYRLIVVEAAAPYAVQVFKVSEAQIEIGRHTYQSWLRKFLECTASGKWGGYAEGEVELVMPSWWLSNREAA